MNISDISVPDIYKESADFRFFLEWFKLALSKVQADTENAMDLYDPLRCPGDLLWLLSDTIGFKYDDRLPRAFNRLVLLYFMSMIRNRGSKDGITLAAETNLAQFNVSNYGKESEILYDRLEDTSIPVNAVYVTGHPDKGYIEVVYFSPDIPVDACIEYVRPVGMYLFQFAGVRFDAKTKISIDARLTNTADLNMSIGSTHIGHYSRDDYARMQKAYLNNSDQQANDTSDTRRPVWYRNKKYEDTPDPEINPGYRALYSLQMSNNEHIFKSLMPPIFGLGYTPTDVEVFGQNEDYPLEQPYDTKNHPNKTWNLRYDKAGETQAGTDIYTLDDNRSIPYVFGKPIVNPTMQTVGDAMSLAPDNTVYTKTDGSFILHGGVNVSQGTRIQDIHDEEDPTQIVESAQYVSDATAEQGVDGDDMPTGEI